MNKGKAKRLKKKDVQSISQAKQLPVSGAPKEPMENNSALTSKTGFFSPNDRISSNTKLADRTESLRAEAFANVDQHQWANGFNNTVNMLAVLFLAGVSFSDLELFAAQQRKQLALDLQQEGEESFGVRRNNEIQTYRDPRGDKYNAFTIANVFKKNKIINTIAHITATNIELKNTLLKQKREPTFSNDDSTKFAHSSILRLTSDSSHEAIMKNVFYEVLASQGICMGDGTEFVILKNTDPLTKAVEYFFVSNYVTAQLFSHPEVIAQLDKLEFTYFKSKRITPRQYPLLFDLMATHEKTLKFTHQEHSYLSHKVPMGLNCSAVVHVVHPHAFNKINIMVDWPNMSEERFQKEIVPACQALCDELRNWLQNKATSLPKDDKPLLIALDIFYRYVTAVPLKRGSAAVGLMFLNFIMLTSSGQALPESLRLGIPGMENNEELPELPADIYAQVQTEKTLYLENGLNKLMNYVTQAKATPKKYSLTECLSALSEESFATCVKFVAGLNNPSTICETLAEAAKQTDFSKHPSLEELEHVEAPRRGPGS